ncbi:hypothetical protein OC834_003866 [Tilletia horrida]|nr:hypothetical protein OC834_003866 [Tilletia horrida]
MQSSLSSSYSSRARAAAAASAVALLALASSSAAQAPSGVPSFTWNLLNVSDVQRGVLCSQQMKFCAQSGCEDPKANITINWCNNQTMGARCACNSGATVLDQYNWPLELADCQGRGSACKAACFLPQYSASLQACQAACDKAYTSTCGTANQVAADYSIMKEGDKPSYAMITGGTAGSVPGAASLRMALPSLASSLALGSLVLGFGAGLAVLA